MFQWPYEQNSCTYSTDTHLNWIGNSFFIYLFILFFLRSEIIQAEIGKIESTKNYLWYKTSETGLIKSKCKMRRYELRTKKTHKKDEVETKIKTIYNSEQQGWHNGIKVSNNSQMFYHWKISHLTILSFRTETIEGQLFLFSNINQSVGKLIQYHSGWHRILIYKNLNK